VQIGKDGGKHLWWPSRDEAEELCEVVDQVIELVPHELRAKDPVGGGAFEKKPFGEAREIRHIPECEPEWRIPEVVVRAACDASARQDLAEEAAAAARRGAHQIRKAYGLHYSDASIPKSSPESC